MVITKTLCDDCVCKKVCSKREEFNELKNNLLKEYGDSSDMVQIDISCKEFYQNRSIKNVNKALRLPN